MKVKAFLAIQVFFISLNVFSQPSEITYQGTIIKSGYSDQESFGPFNIGFSFSFYGNSYNQFHVSSNGLILFGSGSTDGTEDPIPNSTAPNNFIAALWDDLIVGSSGKILYATVGASPNRKLIIQGTNMGFYPTPIFMGTYLVILYESSNKIQVQYRIIVDGSDQRAHGGSATIGIENSTGTEGIQYAYHDPTAISTGQAISFTPSGLSYTMNSDEIYDGVVLTTNLTLPEPGIPLLTSPAQDAVIGSEHTFEWAASPYAQSYTLLLSQFSDLGGATTFNTGTNLSQNVSGLALDATYYWGVFATNATGTTWCEIKRFTTSSAPPLAAVPQAVWIEQGQNKTIRLNYTGGDASAKSAIITTLPAHGQLFQYNAGVKGVQITSVPETISDPGRNVIYTASGSSGNGIGNFNFKINDDTGDSPEATITVNVSPPGIPGVQYVAKGSGIEIQFDRLMADPAGKHDQFTATVNRTPAILISASLKPGDPYTILLTTGTALTGTETVSIAYTQGDIASAQGGFLLSFTAIPVTLRSQTITFIQSLDKKFSQSPFSLTATSGSGLGLTYSSSQLSVATVSGSQVTLRSTGSTDITARQAGNATWAPAKYVRTLNVSKGDQTITFNPLPAKTYGDAGFNLNATASSGLTVSYVSSNPGVATISGNTIQVTGAGSTVITALQPGNTLWNSATDVQQTLDINKATATITLSDMNPVYDGLASPVTATTTPPGLTVDLTYDGLSQPPVNAGSYAVVATIDDDDYQGSQAGSLVISKAPLTATADDFSRPYGEANPPFTISYAGFVAGENVTALDTPPSASSTADGTTGPGTFPITVSGGSDNNYSFSYVDGNLTITRANATVSLSDLTAVYDGNAHRATAVTVPSGLTVTLTYNGDVTEPVNAGSYTVSAVIDDPDYQGTGTGVLVISKAPLTVTADDKSRSYGEVNPPFTLSYTGFIVGEDITVIDMPPAASSTADGTTSPGMIPISVTGGSDNNYEFNYAAGVLTIVKGIANVSLMNLAATYNGFSHPATATTDPSGLRVDFTYNGSPQPPVNAGSYELIGTINDINYIGTATGTLVIGKAPLTITITGIPEKLLAGDSYTLVATTSSGLDVVFESNDINIATVSGNVLTGISKGLVQVRAYNAGDDNYHAAETFATVEIYSTHRNIMNLFTPNYDGINDYWELTELATWGKCDVRVYNRWGKLVFADSDYNNLWDGASDGVPLPEGAYYFIIDTENAGVVKGTVNIVR